MNVRTPLRPLPSLFGGRLSQLLSRRLAGERAVGGAGLSAVCLVLATAVLWACAGGSASRDNRESGRDDGVGLTDNSGAGRIEGAVTIGPLCPVERIPPDPTCRPKPEMFARVKVIVRRPDGATVREVDLDESGNYSVELEPGTYLVGTNDHGFGLGVGEQPSVVVELAAGEAERVDIDIDTGIR